MDTTDLTIEILRSIRDEIVRTNERLDSVRSELGERLDSVRSELGGRLDRVVEEQIRQGTAIIEVQKAVLGLHDGQKDLFGSQSLIVDELRKLNGRIDHVLTGPLGGEVRDHESRLASLESRLATVEEHLEL